MFIKWFKEVFGEWYKENGEIVVLIYAIYGVISFLTVVVTALFVGVGKVDNGILWIWQKACPFMIVTSIIPLSLVIGWRVGNRIRDLYIDYQYFKANGGKRKRDEVKHGK